MTFYLPVDFALLLHVDMRLGGKRQNVTDHRQGCGSRGEAARSPLPQQLPDNQESQAATEQGTQVQHRPAVRQSQQR